MTGAVPNGPIAGMTIVWTGSPEAAVHLIDAAVSAGATVERLPLIAFHPTADPTTMAHIISHLDQYRWIVFTSQEAVRRTAHGPRPDARIAAVGPATARLLAEHGWPATLISKTHDADGLAEELSRIPLQGRPILFVRGNLALSTIPTRLRAIGCQVHELEAYTTKPVQGDRIRQIVDRIRKTADAVLMGSPSGVAALQSGLGGAPFSSMGAGIRWVSLGPTTHAAMRAAGADHAVQLSHMTPSAFIEALGNLTLSMRSCILP